MTAEIDRIPHTYRRVPMWVHRVGRAKVILAAPGVAPRELQGSGVPIWMVLDEPATESEVRERLKDLGVDPPPAGLADAFEHLLDAGLIEPAPR